MTQTYVGMTLLEERVYSGITLETHDHEQRLWMEEHILGTLVPCLQELIQAVRMKQEEEEDPNAIITPPINPIDWLASLLMRNNPKHNYNTTMHPYYQMLKEHVRKCRGLPAEEPKAEAPNETEEGDTISPPTDTPQEARDSSGLGTDGVEAAAEVVAPGAPEEPEPEPEPKPEPPVPVEVAEGLTAAQKEEMWNEMQSKRQKREDEDMATLMAWLRANIEGVADEEGLEALYEEVVHRLGEIMDGVAVYMARYDGEALHYEHVSANCSPKLLSKTAMLKKADCPNAPVFQALEDNSSLHIPGIAASEDVIHIGDFPEKGDGDMFAGSVVDISGAPVAVLIADTLTCNTRKPSPQEVALFGPEGHPPTYRPISEEEQELLQQVLAELSGARVNASASATLRQVRIMAGQAFNKDIVSICQYGVDSLAGLLGPGCNIYVSVLETAPEASVFRVIAQVANPEGRGHTNLLGKMLSSTQEPSGLAFALQQGNGEDNLYYAPNTLEDPVVAQYNDGVTMPNTKEGSACVVGIRDKRGQVVAVLGVEDGLEVLYDAQLAVINTMAVTLSEVLQAVFARKTMSDMSQQALEWIKIQTGLNNLYVSIRTDEGALRYIAATASQDFLLGQQLAPSEGISHEVLQYSDPLHITIADEPKIHLWNETNKGAPGEALMVPITIGDHVAYGVLGADTLGEAKKTTFTEQDIACFTKSAQLLATIFGEIEDGVVNDNTDADKLAIESVVGARAIRFLKKIWLQNRKDLEQLSKNDMQEMAGYKAPPETICKVVSAALIVLGSKPSKVADWKDCRPKIKMPLVEKILKLDPTKPGKKAKFIRSKSMLKALTVDTVHSRGSLPASLLYEWCYISIQLRYAADALRKQAKNKTATSALLEEVEDLTQTIAGGAETEEDTTEDDGDDGEGEDDDMSPDEGGAAE